MLRFIFQISNGKELVRVGPVLMLALYGAVQGLLLYIGSRMDGTLILPGPGKGLYEHYGVWAILITDPLILLTVGIAYQIFRNTIASIHFKDRTARRSFITKLIRPKLSFLELREESKYLYWLIFGVALLCWVNNVYQTQNPNSFYGNDVFDQVNYRWGFLANKLNLFVSWVLIYPAAGFVLITMCFQTRFILGDAVRMGGLEGNLFHPDRCYGYSLLGWLNVALLAPFILPFSVMFFLSITHEALYQTLIFPFLSLVVVFLFASFLTIKPVVERARDIERQTYSAILRELKSKGWDINRPNYNLSLARICLAETHGTPYSQVSKYGMVAIRLVPILLSITGYFFQSFSW